MLNLAKPTVEEYLQAKRDMTFYAENMALAEKQLDKLLDKVTSCRADIKTYKEGFKRCHEVCLTYETYEKVEQEMKVNE